MNDKVSKEEHTRIYTYGGRVAHLLETGGSYNKTPLCKRPVFAGMMYGTGSQSEYEKATSLPLCKDCEKLQ